LPGESSKLFIGIPILNRADLLEQCLRYVDVPAEIVVINNNAVDGGFRRDLESVASRYDFTLLQQTRNLGVAASWNLIVRTALAARHEWIAIGSNDTFLHPGSLAMAVHSAPEPDVAVWHLCDWNFFLIRRTTIDAVGWFDENFYPAYKEDQDYSYRCLLAGLRRIHVPETGGEHVGSATIRSDRWYSLRNADTHFNWNLKYYVMKWGGDAGAEQFTRPYDMPDKDHRWWPEPGESIAMRDWDAGRPESR
jgi:GT2 family glycosyltransferase